ncbi:hypothetical protein CEXT_289171, partial [Caerostris extrusa]
RVHLKPFPVVAEMPKHLTKLPESAAG